MSSRGFTLIELLVAISIIGLLSTLSVVAFTNAKEKARIVSAQTIAKSILDRIGENSVGIWGFDECGGTIAHDGSGQTHDGPISFNTSPGWSTDTALKIGCSLYFNVAAGYNDYVDTTYEWTLQNRSFTVSLWIKTTTTDSGIILSQLTTPILLEGSNGYLCTYLTGVSQCGSKKYNDGKWHLVVVTGDNDNLKIFVDSLTQPYLSVPNTSASWTGYLAIGHSYYGGWNYEGFIDDVRVYKTDMIAQ